MDRSFASCSADLNELYSVAMIVSVIPELLRWTIAPFILIVSLYPVLLVRVPQVYHIPACVKPPSREDFHSFGMQFRWLYRCTIRCNLATQPASVATIRSLRSLFTRMLGGGELRTVREVLRLF